MNVNLDHTVQDLYNYIDSVAPIQGGYTLISGFPSKQLKYPSDSIQKAGLGKA